jgi:hypothetical protein
MNSSANKNLTPKEALHAFCHRCVQSRFDADIESCGGSLVYATGKHCPFYLFKLGKRVSAKVLREQCLECMGGSHHFIRECETGSCVLHPYRFGKNLNKKGRSAKDMAVMRRPDTLFSTGATA